MQLIESDRNDKSQVFFYRCSVCIAEHVSSRLLTTDRMPVGGLQFSQNSRRSSQNFLQSMV
jgi:hypothetical protein